MTSSAVAYRIIALLVALIASVWPLQCAAAAGPGAFSNLACIRVNALRPNESLGIGPSEDELRARLFVAVKAQLPRLRVDAACENELVAWLYIKNVSTPGKLDAHYSHFELRLIRPAILKATQRPIDSEVWNWGYQYGHGPVATARERAMENLDSAITGFAAEYYKAGNP